jgi:hypothetical protein
VSKFIPKPAKPTNVDPLAKERRRLLELTKESFPDGKVPDPFTSTWLALSADVAANKLPFILAGELRNIDCGRGRAVAVPIDADSEGGGFSRLMGPLRVAYPTFGSPWASCPHLVLTRSPQFALILFVPVPPRFRLCVLPPSTPRLPLLIPFPHVDSL